MKYLRFLGAMTLVLGTPCVALGTPLGDTYSITGTNFPNNYDTSLTFDPAQELAGGPAPEGMNVAEFAIDFSGIPGGLITTQGPILAYEEAGTLIEFQFRTADDLPYNNNPGQPWGVTATDIDFGVPVTLLENTTYGYFSNTGGPLVLPDAIVLGFDLKVGPHPTDLAVPQVIFFDNDEVFDADGKIDFEFLDEESELNSTVVGILLSSQVTGLTVGALYQPVPEPSTGAIAVLGFAALGGFCWRARRHRRREA